MQAWKRQKLFGVRLVRETQTRNFVWVIDLHLLGRVLGPIGKRPPTGGSCSAVGTRKSVLLSGYVL